MTNTANQHASIMAARDLRMPVNRRKSSEKSAVAAMIDKKKEEEYIKRINELQGALAQLVQAQQTRNQN